MKREDVKCPECKLAGVTQWGDDKQGDVVFECSNCGFIFPVNLE